MSLFLLMAFVLLGASVTHAALDLETQSEKVYETTTPLPICVQRRIINRVCTSPLSWKSVEGSKGQHVGLVAFVDIDGAINNTFLISFNEEYGEALHTLSGTLHDKCNAVVGISQEEIDDMKKGTFPEIERVQRYVLCLFVASDTISPVNTTVVREVLNHYMPEKLINGTQMYHDCLENAKQSGRQLPYLDVWNMIKCVYRADPEHFVMF